MPYKNKEDHLRYMRALYKSNPEKYLYRQKLFRINRRTKVLLHYGNGIIECACCKEKTYEFLSIDHIDGGGRKHRKSIKENIDRWLIRNNFPEGFRILCHNCNFSEGIYGKCPHKIRKIAG